MAFPICAIARPVPANKATRRSLLAVAFHDIDEGGARHSRPRTRNMAASACADAASSHLQAAFVPRRLQSKNNFGLSRAT